MIGVYFLLRNHEVVYVGQSHRIEKRLIQHSSSEKEFDSYRVISCDSNLLLHYEKRWIKRFNPIYNLPTGGARPGAGRKLGGRFKEPTIVMRIPVSLIEAVKEIINS